jgi:hypothetical protein
MTACKNALIGSGPATATANGVFQINGCVLLFNGKPATSGPDAGLPTLKVFTRVQASNPSAISCANPTTNAQGNATILLNGVPRSATGLYGKVLDVNNITQSTATAFPLEEFKTTIGKSTSTYTQAKCPTTPGTRRSPGPTTTTPRRRSARHSRAPDRVIAPGSFSQASVERSGLRAAPLTSRTNSCDSGQSLRRSRVPLPLCAARIRAGGIASFPCSPAYSRSPAASRAFPRSR